MPSKATKKRRQQKQAEQEARVSQGQQPSTSREIPSLPSTSQQVQTTPSRQIEGAISSVLKAVTISEDRPTDLCLVPKPNPFVAPGRPIELKANYFPICLLDQINSLYHYDLTIKSMSTWKLTDISPEALATFTEEDVEIVDEPGKGKIGKYRCLNTKTNRKVVDKFVNSHQELFSANNYAYDGKKNMYTLRKLKLKQSNNVYGVQMKDDMDREKQYEITIQPAVKEDGSSCISFEPLNALLQGHTTVIPEETIMALETILRHQPAKWHIPVGRSFFPAFFNQIDLPGGRIMKFGYHQSVSLTKQCALLNIDMTATTFFKPDRLLTFLNELLKMMQEEECPGRRIQPQNVININRLPSLSNGQIERFRREIYGAKIYVTHFEPHRKYRVHGVTHEPADALYFEHEKGKPRISVTEYFKKVHGIKLRYGHFPCIRAHKKKPIHFPLEVCEIPEEEHCRRKAGSLQTARMITESACPPSERFRRIQKTVNRIISDFEAHNKSFDIGIKDTPISIPGGILDAPRIQYRAEVFQPLPGEWNLVGRKLLEDKTLRVWAILSLSRNSFVDLQVFSRRLQETGIKFGLTISLVSNIKVWQQSPRQNPCNLLRELCCENKKLELVFVVLRSKNDEYYSKIKLVAETELGIITQCVVDRNITGTGCKEQYLSNVCQKLNGKLGGSNTCIDPNEMPTFLSESAHTMVIGADISHPGPNDDVKHSVASAVGSIDSKMFKYSAAWSIQPRLKNRKLELIKNLDNMVMDLLTKYKNENRRGPDKIIFYRDGVSEGEYIKALDEEVPQVLKACDEIGFKSKPKLTYIIVSKRHHTRFVENPRQGTPPSGNIPPGTTVTSGVTHIRNFDFYLCSQKGLKGTSRPAHYTVIYDQNNFRSKPDTLIKLSYHMCYLSSRCTRSISIPVPVAYADLLANRIRQYLLASGEGSSASSTSDNENITELRSQIIISSDLLNKMFFI